MIKLYYLNGSGKSRRKNFIGKYKTLHDCKSGMKEDLKCKGVNPSYYRVHMIDDGYGICIDYGSHYNFYHMVATSEKSKDDLQIYKY